LLADITGLARAEAADKTCIRWPDIDEFVERYVSAPRGPIVATYPNGDVVTSYWRNFTIHRDPAEGPALHGVRRDGERTVYAVDGVAHRPASDGPAVVDRNFVERTGHTVIEYWEHGQRHRPSSEGPAATHIDAKGNCVLELFIEHGKRHRDPASGPAWSGIEDGLEKSEYMVDGVFHRAEGKGPAVIARSPESGVVVQEFYYRHGESHRLDGPARVERDKTNGLVTLEEYYVDGHLHRDEDEGPSFVLRDSRTGVVLLETYDRNGQQHRIHGPACLYRDEKTGCVRGERWYVDGRPHRNPEEGPSHIDRDANGAIVREAYYVDGALHRTDGPAILGRNEAGRITEECWYIGGKPHRDPKDGPAEFRMEPTYHDTYETVTDETGETREELTARRLEWTEASETRFFLDGIHHRAPSDGPAVIVRDAEGKIIAQEFWVTGEKIEPHAMEATDGG
jgi:hypothetical protein